MAVDAGGAIAISGFNYQKAIISLIAILHHAKEDLQLFLEKDEDVEVILNNQHTFIQIKSEKLSITKLTNRGDTDKSILGKNLKKNDNANARFKVATINSFSDTKELVHSTENIIFEEDLYKYSSTQKDTIKQKLLGEQGLTDSELDDKLDKSYVWLSPFKTAHHEAIPYLLGKMSQVGINVDNERGNVSLAELFLQIDQRSAIIPTDDEEYNKKKRITSPELKKIFSFPNNDILANRILTDCITPKPNLLEEEKIKKELLKILSYHKALKDSILSMVGNFTTDCDIPELFTRLYGQTSHLGEKTVIYAILINIIVERLQEEATQ